MHDDGERVREREPFGGRRLEGKGMQAARAQRSMARKTDKACMQCNDAVHEKIAGLTHVMEILSH